MTSAQLRSCPECRQPWPVGAEHDLRGFGWLSDLPRHVTPSNVDCVIHDGAHGRDRFVAFETKRDGEPLIRGQEWVLCALAGQPGWSVWVLRGTTRRLAIAAVTPDGIREYLPTTPAKVRDAVVAFLEGERFVPRINVAPERECPACHQPHKAGTTCRTAAA